MPVVAGACGAAAPADAALRCFVHTPPGAGNLSGAQLHRQVPQDHWCVTREDLRVLRADTQLAIARGVVAPTLRDSFDLKDEVQGPSVYTFVEQFIKPLSHLVGDTSWALMCHPEGLPCHLFVTHAWAEGVFEFIDKVLNCWPVGTWHAYCCMLSNPQNLDISDMIGTPGASPFARHLAVASHMLVVPNHCVSIYTRIWCVYEAHLAQELGKVILTATPPAVCNSRRQHLSAFFVWAAAAVIGFWSELVRRPTLEVRTLRIEILQLVLAILTFVYAAVVPSRVARCIMPVCHTLTGYLFGSFVLVLILQLSGVPLSSWEPLYPVAMFFVAGYSPIMEAELRREIRLAEQAKQLRRGFTGHVADAISSREEDRETILEEIGKKSSTQRVDAGTLALAACIDVLLRAGMSTPNLRQADESGVEVRLAGHWSPTLLLNVATFQVFAPTMAFCCSRQDPLFVALAGLSALLAGTWLLLFLLLPQDRRGLSTRIFCADSLVFFTLSIVADTFVEGQVGLVFCSVPSEQKSGHLLLLSEMCFFAVLLIWSISLQLLGPGGAPYVSMVVLGSRAVEEPEEDRQKLLSL